MAGINTALDAVLTDLNSRVSTTGVQFERVTSACTSGPRCINTATTTTLGACGHASWTGTPDATTGAHTGGLTIELDGSWPTWSSASLKRTLIHELTHLLGLDNYTAACGMNDAMLQPDFTCSPSATPAYTMTINDGIRWRTATELRILRKRSEMSPRGHIRVLVVTSAIASTLTTYAQRETVHEILARGSTERTRTAPSGRPPSIEDVLSETDVIVRGQVGEPRSYLSDDERDVLTDYPLLNPVVLYSTEVLTSFKPGESPSITVTQLGGTVMVNGVQFTQKELGLLPIQPGTRGVFLLRRDEHYMIARTFYGAFRIEDGKLTPMTTRDSFAPEFRGVPATAAVKELAARANARRQPR